MKRASRSFANTGFPFFIFFYLFLKLFSILDALKTLLHMPLRFWGFLPSRKRSQDALYPPGNALKTLFTFPETLSRRSSTPHNASQRLITPQSDFLRDFQETSTPHNASQRLTTPHKCVPPARPRTITFSGFKVFESSVAICFLCFNMLYNALKCVPPARPRTITFFGFTVVESSVTICFLSFFLYLFLSIV